MMIFCKQEHSAALIKVIMEGVHTMAVHPNPWEAIPRQPVGSLTAVWKPQSGRDWDGDAGAQPQTAAFAAATQAVAAADSGHRQELDLETAANMVYDELERVGKVLTPEEGQALDKQYGPSRGATPLRIIIPTWTRAWSDVVDFIMDSFPDVRRLDFEEGDRRMLTTYVAARSNDGPAGAAAGGESSGEDSEGQESEEEEEEEERRPREEEEEEGVEKRSAVNKGAVRVFHLREGDEEEVTLTEKSSGERAKSARKEKEAEDKGKEKEQITSKYIFGDSEEESEEGSGEEGRKEGGEGNKGDSSTIIGGGRGTQ
jgi:hypothetical protein